MEGGMWRTIAGTPGVDDQMVKKREDGVREEEEETGNVDWTGAV